MLVASPRGLRDWVRLTTQVLTRQKRTDRQLDRLTGRKVSIKVDGRDQFQMDGDTVGECSTMTAEVQPGALRLRVPRESVPTRPSDKGRHSGCARGRGGDGRGRGGRRRRTDGGGGPDQRQFPYGRSAPTVVETSERCALSPSTGSGRRIHQPLSRCSQAAAAA